MDCSSDFRILYFPAQALLQQAMICTRLANESSRNFTEIIQQHL